MPATISPRRTTPAITPNSGRSDAKFFVPSIGSMMNARSGWSRPRSSVGSRSVDSSPTTTAPGKVFRRAAVMAASAASSASVTRSWRDDFSRVRLGIRPRNRGRISARAASRRISTTARVSARLKVDKVRHRSRSGGEAAGARERAADRGRVRRDRTKPLRVRASSPSTDNRATYREDCPGSAGDGRCRRAGPASVRTACGAATSRIVSGSCRPSAGYVWSSR